jgi:hypothetical protein
MRRANMRRSRISDSQVLPGRQDLPRFPRAIVMAGKSSELPWPATDKQE